MARILLIEPDALLGDIYRQTLVRAGHTVVWVKTAENGITELDKTRADVVVLELLLAVHNGVEFLYEMRSYTEWQGISVLLHTDVLKSVLPSLALAQLGISHYLYKPTTSLEQFAKSVERVLLRA